MSAFWFTNRIANPVLRRLLRSPLAARFGRRLAVLRYTGQLSGKAHELVVQCASTDHTIWMVPGQHERKTWWRNFRTPGQVDLWLEGKRLSGQAVVVDGQLDPAEAARGLSVYLSALPHAGRALNFDVADGAITTDQAGRAIIVRITLNDKT